MRIATTLFKLGLPMLILSVASCQRRPLTESDNNVQVNITIDRNIVNYTMTSDPSLMRVAFFDQLAGNFATHTFLPATGGMVGVIPGNNYNVMTYNFDTQSTVVGSEYNWHHIFSTTNDVSEQYRSRLRSRGTKYQGERIVYQPDHHFVARLTDSYIPARGTDAPPVVIDLHAETIVQTWKAYVETVKGMEYVASIAGVVTGLVESRNMSTGEPSDELVSVFLEHLSYDRDGKVEITFNTYGYNPSSRQVLSLVITDTGGTGHEFNIDITDQFKENDDQIITVTTDAIVIDKPETPSGSGGGLSPEVDEWQNIVVDIII